ncbi:envelope stress response membrane protein PspC [Thalassotalea agarivorans]|uniref:Phage shock protein C (PspC) family protein n=1 Tax=Thalassotalea agarivorans TaxID=349064 RepID=A0A1H9ZQY2_THASX|nr:envelope stress response membrane protein PspC [Thalassotalea agarivorans]SES84110.1 phage shock protein C (PspC) family protein [Thalassotalea agarivorans]
MTQKRKELYRDKENGKIAGVCAGIADYFGWETWLIRILVVSCVLFGMGFLIIMYIAAWFILDKKPVQHTRFVKSNVKVQTSAQDIEDPVVEEHIRVKARIWQSGEPPRQAFHDIKRKFSHLEGKLQAMETYVTSPEFTVSREINRL